MEFVVVQVIYTCAEREFNVPAIVACDRFAIADADTAAKSGRFAVVVLIAYIAVESKVVVSHAEVCTSKPSLVLLIQPISQFRLKRKSAEFDCRGEIVERRKVNW